MSVPRIRLGMRTVYNGLVETIQWINPQNRTYGVMQNDTPRSYNDYKPEPSLENWIEGVKQWDRYYQMSDDTRIYHQGEDEKQALLRMYKLLSPGDKETVQKMFSLFSQVDLTLNKSPI